MVLLDGVFEFSNQTEFVVSNNVQRDITGTLINKLEKASD
jgi:hypothetical protein